MLENVMVNKSKHSNLDLNVKFVVETVDAVDTVDSVDTMNDQHENLQNTAVNSTAKKDDPLNLSSKTAKVLPSTNPKKVNFIVLYFVRHWIIHGHNINCLLLLYQAYTL